MASPSSRIRFSHQTTETGEAMQVRLVDPNPGLPDAFVVIDDGSTHHERCGIYCHTPALLRVLAQEIARAADDLEELQSLSANEEAK